MPFVSCKFKQGYCTHQHHLYAYNSLFTYMKAQKKSTTGCELQAAPEQVELSFRNLFLGTLVRAHGSVYLQSVDKFDKKKKVLNQRCGFTRTRVLVKV